MSPSKYLLVSLPSSISHLNDQAEALQAIKSTIPSESGTVYEFPIPAFKIGTLDALVLQADELVKLDGGVEAAVAKVVDVLRTVVGAEGDIEELKMVNDKPVDRYLKSFSWNKVKYRGDKSIAELLGSLQKEVISLDSDIKTKYGAYQQVKSTLLSVQRKITGNLTTRMLSPLVKKSDFILNSEYLSTVLTVVPKSLKDDWIKSYETLSPMVVPRSSAKLAEDEEYILFSATVFTKFTQEFLQNARAKKWTPREFKWTDTARQDDERETQTVKDQERKLYGEIIRLARTGYSDLFAAWMHVKVLQVFVESVLRYGLPLDFVSVIVETRNEKGKKKCKKNLDEAYGYLGGNAFGRDKKGRVKDDGAEDVAGVAAGLVGDKEYSAYCYFEFEVV